MVISDILVAQSDCQITFIADGAFIDSEQEELCIDIRVRDFENVLSVVLPVSYPADLLSFKSIGFTEELDDITYTHTAGSLSLHWEEPGGFGTQNSLDDGHRFATICFDILEIPSEEYLIELSDPCLLYTSPSPRDRQKSRMPSSA